MPERKAKSKGGKRKVVPPNPRARHRKPRAGVTAPKRTEAELAKAPSGSKLSAAHQQLRDTRMLVRYAQGWTWPMIAAEAGMTLSGAKRAVRARRENAPIVLSIDPAKIIEDMAEQLTLSIGDFEAMAAAFLGTNPNAAIGAKRSANDAREQLLRLIQATGRLPQELGALRHLIDLRAIGIRMLDAVDGFERRVNDLEVDAATRRELTASALEVRSTFYDLIGLDDDEPASLGAPAA